MIGTTTAASLVAATTVLAANPCVILPMRERAEFIDSLLKQRLDQIVPDLMRRHDVDMWIVLGGDGDPVRAMSGPW